MMRQIYITANGAVDATGWRGRPRRADSACRGSDSQTYLVRTSLRGRGGFLADVELRTIKEVDLKGGTVVAAFPSVGLVSTITATYLITGLKVDQVVALESPDFPSLSMIYAKKPKFPARVYASKSPKLAIFICEMPLPMGTHRPVAYTLLKWAKDHGCRQIVPLEGLPAVADVPVSGEPQVWGVGSTDRARPSCTAERAARSPRDDRAQTSSLSWRIRSIAPRLKASTSRRARKTAIASKKLRSTLPRRIDSRLTITRIAVRTATTKTVVDRRRRAVSIVRQADGAAVTMESDDMGPGWRAVSKNVGGNILPSGGSGSESRDGPT